MGRAHEVSLSSTRVSADEQLLALLDEEGADEATLYVKGFLGRGEAPDHFEPWLACHADLQTSHAWAARAMGYRWPSGSLLPRSILALGAVKGAWDLYRIARGVRRAARLSHWGALVAEELVLGTAHCGHQYVLATRSARTRADELATTLRDLRETHRYVRVVGHSLGCSHVIEAAALLDPAGRPDEIHLCAPACREDDVGGKLPRLAREQTFLYHTHKDRVLELGFAPLARGRALGQTGPSRAYAGMSALDVGGHFDFWVHNEYPKRFASLVALALNEPGLRAGCKGHQIASECEDD